MLGLGLGLQFNSRPFGSRFDPQAVAHYDRVIADGGTIPAGLIGCNAWFVAVKGAYGVSDITTAISSGLDPHYLGYKLGAGSGATLASAAQKCYNAIGAIGDVIQTTAASQPLILPHTGTNYVWLPGVSGNYFSTPNAVANIITGNLELTAYNINWTGAASIRYLISKTDTYSLSITNSDLLTLEYRTGGSTLSAASTSTISTSFSGSIKVFRNSTTGDITFYTSTDNINFTQLGAVVSGTSGVISNLTNSVFVGSYNSTLATWQGSIGRVTIATSLGGIPVVDFNPVNYNRSVSQTTWTSTTGEVYTVNTPATNNALKLAVVDRSYLMGNGTSMGMRAASFNINSSAFTQYSGFRKFVNSNGAQVFTELGFISGTQGIGHVIGDGLNQENIYLRGNVGIWQTNFTSTNLGLKLSTGVYNTANANECLPYLINNVAQTASGTPATNNNSGTLNSTDFNILARSNATSAWANVMFACDIIAKQEDSGATQTAVYTALKPFLVNCI